MKHAQHLDMSRASSHWRGLLVFAGLLLSLSPGMLMSGGARARLEPVSLHLPATFRPPAVGRAPGSDRRPAALQLRQAFSPTRQQAYLKATNTHADSYFGWRLALDGDTLVVGAPFEDAVTTHVCSASGTTAPSAGAVYIFTRSSGRWTRQAYLKASNAEAMDRFGWSVALAGDTLVVGALGEDSAATGVGGDQSSNAASNAGAAYVFVRSSGRWTQQAYLKASNTEADDYFGYSVVLAGDTLVVSAPFEDSAATGIGGDQASNAASNAGAAYVFVRSSGQWTQQAYLKASNTEADDSFGSTAALSGDTLVVTADFEDGAATGVNGDQASNAAAYAGAAYVFVRSSGQWTQQAYLKASNTEADDYFGASVALAGDTLVVGAWGEDSAATGVNGDQASNAATAAGAAYVFVRSAGQWAQQAYLKASNTQRADAFGYSLALSDDTLVVAAISEDSVATGMNGDQASNAAPNAGASYVFTRSNGQWAQQTYLKASNTGADNYFGYSVALAGNTLVVGAPYEDSAATEVNGDQARNAAPNAGAAYVFVLREQVRLLLPLLSR